MSRQVSHTEPFLLCVCMYAQRATILDSCIEFPHPDPTIDRSFSKPNNVRSRNLGCIHGLAPLRHRYHSRLFQTERNATICSLDSYDQFNVRRVLRMFMCDFVLSVWRVCQNVCIDSAEN